MRSDGFRHVALEKSMRDGSVNRISRVLRGMNDSIGMSVPQLNFASAVEV